MKTNRFVVIKGSGSYLPTRNIPNKYFMDHEFYGPGGEKLPNPNEEIIRKFQEITGIAERRYVTDDLVASDIAYYAAEEALASAGADRETVDYIVVAHNFGDVRSDNRQSDFVPSLASRVKHKLGIRNPLTVPYDLPFGCAGWLEGMIQANYFIRSGDAKRALVIGAETLSRISDAHDRDSMIYADGAGAVLIEECPEGATAGILSHHTESYTMEHAYILHMERSYKADPGNNDLFLKMQGRKVYELALKAVPAVIKKSLDKAGVGIERVHKILIHQANHKMDEGMVKQLYSLYGIKEPPADIMPMTISWLGNSSVATLPTLYDLISRDKLGTHEINPGDVIVFASVGAGININSVVYQVPG